MNLYQSHKHLYKSNELQSSSVRDKRRIEISEIRTQKKDEILLGKRTRYAELDHFSNVNSASNQQECPVSKEDIQSLAKCMQKRSFETKIYLQKLRKSVTQHTMCVEAFIDVPNALWTLVGYLTGTDSQLQLEAAWCITNMCASNHKHTKTIIRAAAPYLITYLSSDNEMLQDHCAWALGNMAGDSKECRDLLKVQGIVHPLVKLLTVSSPGSLGRLPNHVCNEKHPINVFFQTLDPPPPPGNIHSSKL